MQGLEHYKDIIDSYEILTHEEEAELARARDAGDESAIDKLVLHNMKDLVRKVEALKWKDPTEIHDLFMEAMMGMRKAAVKWQPVWDKEKYSKPARFMHFAYWYTRDGINRFCKKFGDGRMVSLDAPRVEDGGDGYESFNSENILGEVEDNRDYLDLDVLDCLTATQRTLFESRVLYCYDDSDEDLAWATGVKRLTTGKKGANMGKNLNRNLMKGILRLIEVSEFN